MATAAKKAAGKAGAVAPKTEDTKPATAVEINLAGFSSQDLLQLAWDVEQELKRRRAEDRKSALWEIRRPLLYGRREPAEIPPFLEASDTPAFSESYADHADPDQRITSREREIVKLLALRLSDKEIAHRLNVSPQTVNSHLKSIYHKLNVHGRRQVAARVREIENLGGSARSSRLQLPRESRRRGS